MGVSNIGGERNAAAVSDEVVWHDLEYGDYAEDLELWHALASSARAHDRSGAILEIGAGTGRVALALARAGHRVTALDSDARLLAALEQRASGELCVVCADARSFELERRDFSLCIVPMQTVQLFGSARARLSFLRRAHAHLSPGGLLAIAIITDFEPFDCSLGDMGPEAESVRSGARVYVSRATRVRRRVRTTLIERERRILDADEHELSRERDVIALDNVSAERLEREGAGAGFHVAERRSVAETPEHVGSVVVMLDA